MKHRLGGVQGRTTGERRRLNRPRSVSAVLIAALAVVRVAVLVGGGFGWVFMTSCSSSGGEAALPTGPPIRIFLADLDASQFEVGFDLIINSGDIEVLSLSDSPVLRSTIRLSRCRVLVRREEILVDSVPFGKQVRLASSARSGFRVGGIRVGGSRTIRADGGVYST